MKELLVEGAQLLVTVQRLTQETEASKDELDKEWATLERERREMEEERDKAMDDTSEAMAEVKTLREALKAANQREEALKAQLGTLQPIPIPDRVEEDTGAKDKRLQTLEQELERTRLILASERLRRNRAISLIKPAPPAEVSS